MRSILVYKDPGIAPSTSHWAREVYQRPSQVEEFNKLYNLQSFNL